MKTTTEIQKIREDVDAMKKDISEIKDMFKQIIDDNKMNDINKEIISKINQVIVNTKSKSRLLGIPG